jgi:hypothetical protein
MTISVITTNVDAVRLIVIHRGRAGDKVLDRNKVLDRVKHRQEQCPSRWRLRAGGQVDAEPASLFLLEGKGGTQRGTVAVDVSRL